MIFIRISYKKLYEEQVIKNEQLQEKIWELEDEITRLNDEIEILRNGYDPSDDEHEYRVEVLSGLRGKLSW